MSRSGASSLFLAAVALLPGCVVAAVVVVAAAIGVGAYFYLDNVLSYEYEASLDDAFEASKRAIAELGLPRDQFNEKKDFQEGLVESRMADGRQVKIVCEKLGEKKTKVKVRVGDFKGEANRQGAQCIHETIAKNMGLKAPSLPPPDKLGEDEIKRTYKAGVPACHPAAQKACEKSGFKIAQSERSGEERGTLSGQKEGRNVFVSMYRHDDKTGIIIQVRGGSTDANKSEAKALHDSLGDELQEKGED